MSAEAATVPVTARLRVTETFLSLQGEAAAVGWPTFFIRLTGCPLRCRYCDTPYAFEGGEWRDVAGLVEAARAAGARHACVTGGEPLAQRGCLPLLAALCDAGFSVSLETSGALDASGVDARVARVIDVKTPGSGEAGRNLALATHGLRPDDQIKFVITDRLDYEWSRNRVRDEGLDARCQVLFSAAQPQLPPARLADWILADRLPVRFQVQLHKMLWGDVPGR